MRTISSPLVFIAQVILVILIAGVFVLGMLQVGGVILDSLSYQEVSQSDILLAIMYINLLLVLVYFVRGNES